jgi:hypothetical protein
VTEPDVRGCLLMILEIPLHRDMTSFFFYDVLLAVSHYRCQSINSTYKERFMLCHHGTLLDARSKKRNLLAVQLRRKV